ncbi:MULTISPECIES: glycosyltransferase [unclassified Sphingobium]|uniref:glycosyltransferase n=1 Tax=unclassified Sphingobium TaxID=2611147 RepID=UPI00222478E5|nr:MULTISPECIES: glycosyltransferase [unclassified Sphingobium]MCW2382316.1 glycosyltransferase involved in cell wall biosynthesis [Sphingobium sp. B2D3B]MCW2397511.1 glycosyltransferase involved in cell wall biosynthesis [Sphingobium sp. B2D3C]
MADEGPLFVLSVLHSLEPGGVERDLLRFTKAWREAGLDARIALGRWEGRLQEEAPDVPYIIPPPGRLARIETESLWMMLKLPGIVRRLKPDVLFFPSNGLMAVAAVTRLVLGKSCPPIVLRPSNSLDERHSSPLRRRLSRFIMHGHSHIYAAVVAMAPPVRDEIETEMGVPPERIAIIHNASMTAAVAQRLASLRDSTPRNNPGRHFLGVGRLFPQKNFELLLDAFARIAQPDDRLTIVGEGPLRAALEAKAQALGVATQLSLPGHHNPVDPWFAQADAFILSSDFEGVPAVVAEALAAAIPIVATDCTIAMPMMMEDVGTLVPIKDVSALAAAMDRVCDQKPQISAMRARASLFTMEATLEKWIALFRRVVGK